MAATAAIQTGNFMRYPTFLQAHAIADAEDDRATLQWQVYHSYQAVTAGITTPPRHPLPTVGRASGQAAITTAQHIFSSTCKPVNIATKITYGQRVNDLHAAISTHSTNIEHLKTQLSILNTERLAEHMTFDALDAQDLAFELESRHGLSTTAEHARTARAAKRIANTALITSLNEQISAQNSAIADAHTVFETQTRRLILSTAKTSLRALRVLKATNGAKIPRGLHRVSFWTAVHRALMVNRGAVATALDEQRLDEYRRELEGPPVMDRTLGMPPAPEVVEQWPELGEERDGLFSVGGWR